MRAALSASVIRRLNLGVTVTPSGCWEWQGARIPKGYGYMSVSAVKGVPKHVYVHRLAWEVTNGPIPPDKHVCHRCDNPPCINPDHLWLGTNVENRHDSIAKRRWARGEWAGPAKLTDATVLAIRADRRAGLTLKEIAAEHGVPYKTVDKIVYRVSWKHLP